MKIRRLLAPQTPTSERERQKKQEEGFGESMSLQQRMTDSWEAHYLAKLSCRVEQKNKLWRSFKECERIVYRPMGVDGRHHFTPFFPCTHDPPVMIANILMTPTTARQPSSSMFLCLAPWLFCQSHC